MTATNNTRSNPYFEDADRPVYELSHLLRKLPAGLTPREMSADQTMVAQAIKQHASNGLSSIFHSIQALGELMSMAAGNTAEEILPHTQNNLASLIQSLGEQAQTLYEMENSTRYLLSVDADHALKLIRPEPKAA